MYFLFKAHERQGRCEQCVLPAPMVRLQRWGRASGGMVGFRDSRPVAVLTVESTPGPDQPEGETCPVDGEWVKEFAAAIRTVFPVRLHLEWRKPVLSIAFVAVHADSRGKGVFRRVVETLVAEADRRGFKLAVTPTDEFGAEVWRLRWFYRQLGFVRNAGEIRDFACKEDLIRPVGGENTC
ncbi:GNAT family N-acetyltransferase [Streptomyces andamanensis]|uniref:GNAT family N-acetyltransferase n=1 Tax=Streptomyces andamanensis TaxID=1565035 RepID=A0ABV8TCJ7_9ACTN